MRPRIGTSLFVTAIAASAAAHALLVASFRNVRVGGDPAPQRAEVMVVYEPDEPQAAPDEFEMGHLGGTGYGTHDLAGRREQLAREAPHDQPQLSLDPVGQSVVVEAPSAPAGIVAAAPVVVAAAPPPPVRGLADRVLKEAAQWAPPAPQLPVAAAIPSPRSGADPAPQGDSEVDAFSVLGSAQFRDGRVSVRAGRQVKTRRPKIGLAGMVDLAQRTAAQVVLKVAVDATGKVTDVDVVRSSGSNEIDQPCRVAMYEWWFEPKKDADGHRVPDVFQFTITFR